MDVLTNDMALHIFQKVDHRMSIAQNSRYPVANRAVFQLEYEIVRIAPGSANASRRPQAARAR